MTERALVDRFVLLRAIGVGGATELWLANDRELGGVVALRVLESTQFADCERFRDACRTTRRLGHPSIARFYDYHRDGETHFLSRQFLEGNDLSGLTGRPYPEIAKALVPIADALAHAHAEGVLHGDLKASKLVSDPSGRLKIVDLQIASNLRDADVSVAGDLASQVWLSPQVRAHESPQISDDVYSLGVLLDRLLRGSPMSLPGVRSERWSDESDRGSAPAELSSIVDRMIAERRSDRPVDMGEVRDTLAGFAATTEPPASSRAEHTSPPAASLVATPARLSEVESVRAKAIDTGWASTRSNGVLWASLGILAATAAFVFFVLPRWVNTSATPESASTEGSDPSLANVDELALPLAVRRTASRLVDARQRLEGIAVARWAPEMWAKAIESQRKGEQSLAAREYAAADIEFQDALPIFAQLEAQSTVALQSALSEGADAILASDRERAAERFDLALAIAPDNAAALAGIARVETLDEVLAHMHSAESFEATGDLSAAIEQYELAIGIDPLFHPATASLKGVRQRRSDEVFQQQLSGGLRALANGQLPAARKQLEAARQIQPASVAVVEGLGQLRDAETVAGIGSKRRQAERAEREEQWPTAAARYRSILKVDSRLEFANDGLERSLRMARLNDRVDELIADPSQLFDADVITEARTLLSTGLAETGSALSSNSALGEKMASLDALIAHASTPIAVRFESDSLTEVVIQRHGTLGSFRSHEVPLKPGTYTVFGRRDGYRDVRHVFSVLPGAPTLTVDVHCSDEI